MIGDLSLDAISKYLFVDCLLGSFSLLCSSPLLSLQSFMGYLLYFFFHFIVLYALGSLFIYC